MEWMHGNTNLCWSAVSSGTREARTRWTKVCSWSAGCVTVGPGDWNRTQTATTQSNSTGWHHHWNLSSRVPSNNITPSHCQATAKSLIELSHPRNTILQTTGCTPDTAHYSKLAVPVTQRTIANWLHLWHSTLQHTGCTPDTAHYSTLAAPLTQLTIAHWLHLWHSAL